MSQWLDGVEWVCRHLEAAATVAEADKRGEITSADGKRVAHDAIIKSGAVHFGRKLRELAGILRYEAAELEKHRT
jgi:hypothetical protein